MAPAYKLCKLCGRSIIVWNTLQNKCKGCTLKTAKKIPVKGKRAKEYETWRDVMAIPYLDKRYGLACSKCGVMPAKKEDGSYYRHDVDHKLGRGSHAKLKMQVTNTQYLCRNCHSTKTDGKDNK